MGERKNYTSTPDDDDNRWSLEEEISKVFKTALNICYPDLPDEEPNICSCINQELGDYQCHNIHSIYDQKYEDVKFITRKTRKDPKFLRRGRKVSEVLKKYLLESAYDMIEECSIHGNGDLTFKLSRSWIAKSIHKMLINGIDTLAPKHPVKRAVVVLSSQNIDEKMNWSHLHSAIFGDTLARMLDFFKVDVLLKSHVCKSTCIHGRPMSDYISPEVIESQKCYKEVCCRMRVPVRAKGSYTCYIPKILHLLDSKGLIENSEGDKVIFIEEGMIRISIEKKKIPLTVVSRNGCLDAARDLADLWYQLKEEKADWIVYVADLGTAYLKKMCFMAARFARWLPSDMYEYPRTTFVGVGPLRDQDNKRFQACSTEIIDFVDLLDEAKSRCKLALVKQGKADKWTLEELEHVEALGYGALKYEFLKKRKVLDYTFNFDDMFNDKGNTVVYLLYAHAQISSIIKDSGKNIEELKKTGVLILEEDEERELGLHILQFTEVLNDVCTAIEPKFLCEYLYELSKKFTSFYSVCEVVGSDKETSRLLVCEATSVVMRKCFLLLGIECCFELKVDWKYKAAA